MRILLFIILFTSIKSYSENIGFVKQIDSANMRIAITIVPETKVSPGQTVILTYEDGKQCSFDIESISESIALTMPSPCFNLNSIKVNQIVELSLFKTNVNAEDKNFQKEIPDNNSNISKPDKNLKPNNSIESLTFMPEKGSGVFNINYNRDSASRDYLVQNIKFATEEIDVFNLNLTLEYSFLDNFSFGVNYSFLENQGSETRFSQEAKDLGLQDYTSNNSGFSDPTLGFRFRLVDNKEANVITDFYALYSPSTGRGKEGTENVDGNALRGGAAYGIQGVLGKTVGSNEFVGKFIYLKLEDLKVSPADDTSDVYTTSGSDDITLAFNYRNQLSEIVGLYLGYIHNEIGKREIKYSSGGNTKLSKLSSSTIEIGLRYTAIQDKLLLSVNYGRVQVRNFKQTSDNFEFDFGNITSNNIKFDVSMFF